MADANVSGDFVLGTANCDILLLAFSNCAARGIE